MQIQGNEPSCLFINYTFEKDKFICINAVRSCNKRGRAVTCDEQVPVAEPCFKEKLAISKAKKEDLLSLCRSGIIPEEYHPYYTSLPVSSVVRDRLPLPDREEGDEDTETEL